MKLDTTDGVLENFRNGGHRREKSWIATVTADRSAPGGLARSFWPRTRGTFATVPAALAVGDVVEVASDYYSGGGTRRPDRRYCRVAHVGDGYLIVLCRATYPQARDAEPTDEERAELEAAGVGLTEAQARAAAVEAPMRPTLTELLTEAILVGTDADPLVAALRSLAHHSAPIGDAIREVPYAV